MKKGESLSKLLAIALVFALLASTLGALAWAGGGHAKVAGSADVSAEQPTAMTDSNTNVIALDASAEGQYLAGPIAETESASSLRTEIDASLDAGRLVFLFFHADWCHFCEEQMPIIEELELEYAEEIVVIHVNSEDNPQAMTEFGVTGFPAMFLISSKGSDGEYRYQEFKGFADKETLSRSFDWVITYGSIPEGSGTDSGAVAEGELFECEAYWNGPVMEWDGFILPAPHGAVTELPSPEDLCPWCPKPEPGWGELVGCTCSGNDWWQRYNSASGVELTGCYYANHNLTQRFVELPSGVEIPLYTMWYQQDHCLDDYDIALHRCVNGVAVQVANYTCPYGCENDQCICSDTDGGDDPNVLGCVRNGTSIDLIACDECSDFYRLTEYYTKTDLEDDACRIMQHPYTCPGGCDFGACQASCTDGVQDGDETGIDCGGSCKACPYEFGWYAQHYGFKFGNPGGRDLSYGRCWSEKKSCAPGYGHYKDTFGNCEVCICNRLFSCCSGWHVHAGLYYAAIYWWAGAAEGQCQGMSLASLEFYYGHASPDDYQPYTDEVVDLDYGGDLKRHIASEQSKIVSGEMIDHYLSYNSEWWGANDVLEKVEHYLNPYDYNPREYGMITLFEDNGWDGWKHRTPLAHTVIATDVVYVNDDTARIYVYDPNTPVDVYWSSTSPYFSINSSPYIEIDIPSNTYTFYDDPPSARTDSEGEPWTNSNAVGDDEYFDRIGYTRYGMLHSDVDIPWEWDVLLLTFIAAIGSADAQVEDSEGAIVGFSEQGPSAPAIENAIILPVFGEPDPNLPTTFAMPMGDYKINVRGITSGNYSAYILGGGNSTEKFVIADAEVSDGTRDTISVQYGTQGRAMLSFTTSDAEKRYSCLVASQDQGEEGGTASEALFGVNSVISSGSEALFSVDMYPEEEDGTAHGPALIYSNHGDEEVTYFLQIYTPPVTAEEDWEGLVDIIDNFPATDVHNFTIGGWQTHTIYPKDWSNLRESQIIVEVDICGDTFCDTHENYLICPQDCPSGVADGYCDGVSDDICDPDCTAETDDPDCVEASDDGDGGLPGGCVPTAADMIPLALISVTLVSLSVRRWRGGGL